MEPATLKYLSRLKDKYKRGKKRTDEKQNLMRLQNSREGRKNGGKSAALSNFHLKADQDGLASNGACCQPSNIVSTMAQTKRCWARPSQFIRVWIQRRICLVLLESRSDLCLAISGFASNRKNNTSDVCSGVLTPHLRAREARCQRRPLALETVPLRPDTVAALHTSTAIVIVMGVPIRVERGEYHQGRHIRRLVPLPA